MSIMRGIKQRDLDAFRRGIEAQVREECASEQSQRIQEEIRTREWLPANSGPELIQATRLVAGDALVASDGDSFWVHARVTGVFDVADTPKPALWVEYAHVGGGTGGSRWEPSKTVLRQHRYQRPGDPIPRDGVKGLRGGLVELHVA